MTLQNTTAHDEERTTQRFLVLCCLGVFAAVCLFAICFVPMNMDEAGIYHALACLDHPFAKYNIFRETCYVKNDLTLIGGFSLLRPQFYTGLFHSLLYVPFYKIFHAQIGQYLFGLLFLCGFAWLMARETKAPKLAFALLLSFFPLTFQFIHDTGPVKFALLLFPLTALCLRKILQPAHGARLGYALLLPLALCLAIEEKAFFLYLMPSVMLFALALACGHDSFRSVLNKIRDARHALALSLALFLAGTLTLLLARNAGGITYIEWLMSLVGSASSFAQTLATTASYLFFWPAFAHNFFEIDPWSSGAILLKLATLAYAGTLCAAAWHNRKAHPLPSAQMLLLTLSFFALIVVFLLFGNAWAGHHFIYLWAPLLFAFCAFIAQLPPKAKVALTFAYLALNLFALLNLTQQKVLLKVDPEKEAIFEYLNDERRAAQSLYNFTTWGGYYIQALYGPKNQMAVYTEPYEAQPLTALYPQYAAQILDIARQTERKIYTICTQPFFCTKKDIEQAFGGKLDFKEVLIGLQNWHIFVADPVDSGPARS